ncbi:MAG: SPOR domain-containing protein [Gemmatimonadota bacterium]
MAVAVPAVTLGCAVGGALSAQPAGPADLGQLEAAIDAGSLDGVRARLDSWLADAADASPEDMGRARFLRARLMSDPDSARDEYLAVALDARSSYGAPSWLRLAHLDLARGQTGRAVEDLERLRADYPRSAVVPASWYWTARALESGGELEDACSAFDRALNEASASGDAMTGERAMAARRACDPGGLRFTLQIGAFSGESAARSLSTTALALGFPTRIVRENDLKKVRVGRFGSPDAARVLEKRLREDGFTVVIVAVGS